MPGAIRGRTLGAGRLTLLAIVAAAATVALGASTAHAGLIFDGNFEDGFAPWGSKPMCANYGTPSKSPRLRGNFYFSSLEGEGTTGSSGRFSLPANTYGTSYPFEACAIGGPLTPDTLPADDYYGLMVYVPQGWTIANNTFGGVNILELHFQNIYGAPVTLQLHPNHVTLAFETGPCNTWASSTPGCQFRSNADAPSCHSTGTYSCGPGAYAIPPGAFVQGAWNEIILGIHWASDATGQVQSWYRVKGAPSWNQGSSMSGHPTVQWDQTKGCCPTNYDDQLEAYTGGLTAPLSVWLDNEVIGTSFASVAATMPGGVSGLGGPGGGAGGPGGFSGASPRVSGLHISPRTFALSGRRVGRRCVPARRSNRRRARCARRPDFTVSYVLNTAATVSFTVTKLVQGRSVHGRCMSPARARGHGPPCQRRVNAPGTIVRQGGAGLDAFTFAGRTDGHRLGPGSYILTATPISPTATGRPVSLRFSLLP